jgi:hypothetical protein
MAMLALTRRRDFLAHWLWTGEQRPGVPAIFYVNWFRRGSDGKPPAVRLRAEQPVPAPVRDNLTGLAEH